MRGEETITTAQLEVKLKEIDGKSPTFISLVSVTDARLKKTNNPFKDVVKISSILGRVNTNYQNAVTNKLEKQGEDPAEFKFGERKYGTKDDEYNGCLLTHGGQSYLCIEVDKVLIPGKFYDKEKARFLSRSLVEPFLPASNNSQPVVAWRNYKLSSIRKIKMKGITYKIEG
jgi:hypothetical protein